MAAQLRSQDIEFCQAWCLILAFVSASMHFQDLDGLRIIAPQPRNVLPSFTFDLHIDGYLEDKTSHCEKRKLPNRTWISGAARSDEKSDLRWTSERHIV